MPWVCLYLYQGSIKQNEEKSSKSCLFIRYNIAGLPRKTGEGGVRHQVVLSKMKVLNKSKDILCHL